VTRRGHLHNFTKFYEEFHDTNIETSAKPRSTQNIALVDSSKKGYEQT